MEDATLKATAYHEAGHAVVSYLYGRRFKRVSIEPEEDYLGCVEYYDNQIIRKILEGTHCVIWLMEHPEEEERIIERAIRSTMAGYVAQEMGVTGSVTSEQWESDREHLGDILISWYPAGGWDEAKRDVEAILTEHWQLVERLAEALLSNRTLTGKEARAILESRGGQ